MFFFGRIEYSEKRLASAAFGTKIQMVYCGTGQHVRRFALNVLNRDIFNILPEELPCVRRSAESLGFDSRGDYSVHDRLLHVADPTVFF